MRFIITVLFLLVFLVFPVIVLTGSLALGVKYLMTGEPELGLIHAGIGLILLNILFKKDK